LIQSSSNKKSAGNRAFFIGYFLFVRSLALADPLAAFLALDRGANWNRQPD